MSASASASTTSDTAILSRLIRPEVDNLTVEAAEALLSFQFSKLELDRIHELIVNHQEDRLTAEEQNELANYRRVSFLLDLIHSKARRSLIKHQAGR